MGQRPADLKPPAYLAKSPPVPKPAAIPQLDRDPDGLDPTRYGDWEIKGKAIDF